MAEYNSRMFEKLSEDKGFKTKTSCFFRAIGCKFKGGRAKVQKHEAESVRQHLNLLMDELANLNQKSIPANLLPDTSRTLTQWEREIDRAQKGLQNDHQINEICKKLEEFCKLMEAAYQCVTIVETQFTALEDELATLPEKINKCSRIIATLNRQTECNDQLFTDVEDKLTILESKMHRTKQAIQVATAKRMAMEPMMHGGLFIWKIPQINKMLQEAIDGARPFLDSSEFYISSYSYKMCLRIYLNGHEDAKGTHISLYYIVLKGPYDALTQWPFKEKVKLALLNPRNRQQSILRICTASGQDPALQRPGEGMNPPHGFPMFLSLSEFNHCFSDYVDSNEIFVGAEIVPTYIP
ncbi:TNF receptor-associated factor 1-like [Narcine bancroftii]|uniref:TNF receptor-associated factor 1-like n=1 Tax=Narcine bancroftii TaxID=1343680 RepID=UPI003831E1D9